MYDKLLWFNPNIQYLINENIVEYDMKAMSVSVSEKYHLLDDETIRILKLLPKDERTRRMGMMQKNKEFSQKLISCELESRLKFIQANNLNDNNIVSLHSDAIIFNSKKDVINVVDGIEFKHDNTWSSYINYQNMEMFYNNGEITYKNIPKDTLNMHTLGINKYLCNIFNKLENYDYSIIEYINKFQDRYLKDKLPDYYYIPFGRTGVYKMSNLNLFAYIANIVIDITRRW